MNKSSTTLRTCITHHRQRGGWGNHVCKPSHPSGVLSALPWMRRATSPSFYADGITYYQAAANNGYEGRLGGGPAAGRLPDGCPGRTLDGRRS